MMGVDLRKLVKPKRIRIEDLSGKKVAIDAYNALYQFLATIRGEAGEYLMDRAGRVTSHLSGLFYRTVNLLEMGIKPVYVFDGMPPSLKAKELERRRVAKLEAMKKYEEAVRAGRLEEAKKYAQRTSMLKDYMVEDAKRLLDLMGVPWIQAPSEGEATAAHLVSKGYVWVSASQDYDSLLFGAPRLVRNLTISGRRKLPNRPVYVEVLPELVELDEVLKDLGITREQLIDVGILLGTDFNPGGFKGIGPVKALKYVKEYGSLERIPEIRELLDLIDYQRIREIFLNPKVAEPKELVWREPDEEGIVEFLCGERDFSEGRVRKALSRLKKAPREASLDQFF